MENGLPRHLAIIMDGNGRWATRQGLARSSGHRAGRKTVRTLVEAVANLGIPFLTVFAFSSENWKRPKKEVQLLLELFNRALRREVQELHEKNIRIRFIGDLSGFSEKLQEKMAAAEKLTADNQRMRLNIAVNYGGRWDICQAARKLARQVAENEIDCTEIDEQTFARALTLGDEPDPDLLIRTGGEERVSNFLLWQLAYCEIYFSPTLWPDFGPDDLDRALREYQRRQRRFGSTPLQVASQGQRV